MAKQKINTLLFDFGNVLLPLQVEATYASFKALGAKPTLQKDATVFHQWEKGQISSDEFISEIRKHLKYAAHAQSIWQAWNAMILDFPEENRALLKRLKKKYRLILVSNINHEHEQHIKQRMGPFGYGHFLSQFSGIYYSHHMGLRKPEKAFFHKVLTDQKIKPEHAFFIDDTEANIEVANGMGIQSWHFDPTVDSILDLPKKLARLTR